MRQFKGFAFWRAFLALLASSLFAFGQSTDPVLKPFTGPKYPPIARTARIQGAVTVEFFVNHNGDVVSVDLVSGHPMLAATATETVQRWKFQMPKQGPQTDQRYETVFSFELAETSIDSDDGQQVIVESFRHVRILSEPTMIGGGGPIHSKNCPTGKDALPPTVVSDTDSIEMARSQCRSVYEAYTVRIHADGKVEWDGKSYVNSADKQNTNISPMEARNLIEKFRSPDFWALCSLYTRAGAHDPATTFIVNVGKHTKIVSNYADSAPEWLVDLENDVDNTANTHQWRHGDPLTEPLIHISADADMPKPGVTPLMRAAAHGDIKKVTTLLNEGADAGQTDSSGWTALMYASPTWCGGAGGDGTCVSSSNLLKLLIAAGADANYNSPRGDTPLMAAAYDGRFEKDLVAAGANVNAQNLDGVSALMILVTTGRDAAVQGALTAGANAKLKDNQGRSALDYLHLANCNRSPVRNPLEATKASKKDCDNLVETDFENIEKLLQKAVATP